MFKEYFGDLIRAILACQQIVVVLDGAVAAEEQLWGAVRNDVPQSIHRLAGACKRIAGGSSARVDLDGVLNGTALGLGVASVVISGPVGVTIGIVSLGLSVVTMSGVTGTEGFDAIEYLNPQPAPLRNCDNALDVLEEMLNGSSRSIDQNITSFERKIADTLDAAIDQMELRRSAFDPIAERISAVTPETLKYDQAIVDRVNEGMDYAAEELSAIVTLVRDCRDGLPGSSLRRRSDTIGVDPYGRLERLLELLETDLTEIAAEATAGAAYFRAAMESYAQNDAATQERLRQLSQAFMDADTSGLGSDDSAPGVGPRLVREVTEMVPLIIPDLWRMRG